jgi:hypothetical protein
MIDRDVFFNEVRTSLFDGAMSQEQVDGMSVILAVWDYQAGGTPATDQRWLAYMLATTFHETAARMWPIEEYGRGQGHSYGEEDPETGQTYYGRGFVQLTWRENYSKASKILALYDERDLEYHAWMALDSLIATRVLFRGMAEGWFTGRKLGEFFNDDTDDPVEARIIINNDVSKNGQLIAGYHDAFLAGIQKADKAPGTKTDELIVKMTVPPGVRVEITET